MNENKTQEGFLVLADISGYTSFLTLAELDHAREIITELLELIMRQFTPLLTISKLEGDAVFAYVPAQKISRGEILLEVLESTYLAFRNRIQSSKRLTTCSCRGCKAMATLDLKFVAHYGRFALQEVAGHKELVGHDVVVAHRLLKNRVTEANGWRAYMLFTKPALDRVGIDPQEMFCQQESYEHLGTVDTFITDLRNRYDELTAARRVYLAPEDAHVVLTTDLEAPPVLVWDWLNDPQKRLLWSGTEVRPVFRPGGRTKEGAQNHCVHGKSVSVEQILDWRPFEYFTVEVTVPIGSIRTTYALRESSQGTALEDRTYFQPRPGFLQPLARPLLKLLYRMINASEQYRTLERAVREDREKIATVKASANLQQA